MSNRCINTNRKTMTPKGFFFFKKKTHVNVSRHLYMWLLFINGSSVWHKWLQAALTYIHLSYYLISKKWSGQSAWSVERKNTPRTQRAQVTPWVSRVPLRPAWGALPNIWIALLWYQSTFSTNWKVLHCLCFWKVGSKIHRRALFDF